MVTELGYAEGTNKDHQQLHFSSKYTKQCTECKLQALHL